MHAAPRFETDHLLLHRPPANARCGNCAIRPSIQALVQTFDRPPVSRTAAMKHWSLSTPNYQAWSRFFNCKVVSLAVLALPAFVPTTGAVYVDFDNCLSPNIIHSASQPQPLLQFIPYHVWASFNDSAPSHTLNITVYGNITGTATNETRPAWNDPQWQNDNKTLGKIVDEDQSNNHYSTFFARFNVLDYTPYNAPASRFCTNTIHQQCPLIPAFNVNANA